MRNQLTIYLPVETKSRELPYKSPLAFILADLGCKVIIGRQQEVRLSWYKSNNNARLETIAGEKEPYNPKIKIPSAVLWGKHDPILRSNWAGHLHDNFENIIIEFANESGHFVHFEQSDLAADFVRRSLNKWQSFI